MEGKVPLKLLWLSKVSSTQEVAKRLSFNCAVLSNIQTSGKGTAGKSWHSESGGLYLSVNVEQPKKSLELLSLAMGVAVAKLLEGFNLLVGIKWVNDIYFQDKKLAGILIENSKNSSIIGIGINVNQVSFPKELNATSLYLILQRELSLKELALELLSQVFIYLEVLSKAPERIVQEVSKKLLYVGKLATSGSIKGTFIGISENGYALLKSNGKVYQVRSGELKF
ncbi:MAG: biotin--[acetyl-CoA-carboxylase] ligase [Aquificaceae bacterium]|nr:biotin--[acetyl-CoA-carboxylase] ligase [Aquificaceae bacterium]